MWQPTRRHSIIASRIVILIGITAALGSYAFIPATALAWLFDIFGRGYIHFVLGGMAHEGTHGALGNTKAANLWWTRLALLPTTVPSVMFRKTHHAHHRFTNEPEKDPDAFLHTDAKWQIPLRILAMPHHWLLWLRRHGKLKRADMVEYVLTYAVYFSVYAAIAAAVGPTRFLIGLFGACIVHSFLLWYPFAIKTHEGYSVGDADSRSHEYYGAVPYWFSFGLSMHRLHHVKPTLGWLEMLPHVRRGTFAQQLFWRRHIVPHASQQ